MKIFKYYFFAGLLYAITGIAYAIDFVHHFLHHTWRLPILLLILLTQFVLFSSILHLVLISRERRKVIVLFLPITFVSLLLCVGFVAISVLHELPATRFSAFLDKNVGNLAAFWAIAAPVFTVGCFKVKSPRILKGCRICALILLIVLMIFLMDSSIEPGFIINHLHGSIPLLILSIAFLPLAPVHYRFWTSNLQAENTSNFRPKAANPQSQYQP